MMSRWAIMRSDEDGRHFRPLTEASLHAMLANPDEYGIKRFETLDQLDADPAYWPREVAVLLRVDAILPEPIAGYRLPEYIE
jgi:hypothetical protein